MTTMQGETTPRAHGTLKAIDQFVPLCLVSHPRCGWWRTSSSASSSHNCRIAAQTEAASNAVKQVWEMVKDTRRQFAVEPYCFTVKQVWEMVKDTRRQFAVEPYCFTGATYWLIKFEVSPLVLGIIGDPAVTADEFKRRSPTLEWVGNRQRLVPPFALHDLVTGEEVSLFPRAVPRQPSGIILVHAVNRVWFVGSGYESDYEEGNTLGISIGRLAHKDPGATSVVVRLGYSAVSHKVTWVFFNKWAGNEVVAVVRNRKSPEKCVFVVIDVERSFSSQSLCVLSETSIELAKGCCVWHHTVILMYTASCTRSFIAEVYLVPSMNCIQISESNGNVVVLPQTMYTRSVAPLSSHMFAVVTVPQPSNSWLCDIWDCNELTRPLLRVSDCRSQMEAEAGLLFSIEGHELTVMEPLTGFTVLHVSLPSIGDHLLGYPFCFH
ncbi:hypothetical protein Pelo_9493 [Pelomyxa schiedti]|nr:hypothetical protein Pelo_9493 [Pelomyxa schiedti]